MTKTSNHARLLEHVLILDRLSFVRRVIHPESLAADKRPLHPEVHRRKYAEFAGDAHHLGGELFAEVPFACACGTSLDRDPERALQAWASHAFLLSGFKEALLLDHVVLALRGTPATAHCLCGRAFSAPAGNPHDPGAALAAWLEHLEERA